MTKDRATGLSLLILCSLGWFFLVPHTVEGDVQRIFPRCVLGLLALPALGLCLRRPRIPDSPAAGKAEPPEVRARRKALQKAAFMAFAYLVYLLLIPGLGFFACSFCAGMGFLYFMGVRGCRSLVLVPAVILLCAHLVIERCLHFDLPHGLLY